MSGCPGPQPPTPFDDPEDQDCEPVTFMPPTSEKKEVALP
jgi:hypothetical protein